VPRLPLCTTTTVITARAIIRGSSSTVVLDYFTVRATFTGQDFIGDTAATAVPTAIAAAVIVAAVIVAAVTMAAVTITARADKGEASA
jgi:hypothetical protein